MIQFVAVDTDCGHNLKANARIIVKRTERGKEGELHLVNEKFST